MKRYTRQTVAKWLKAENFINKIRKQKPFPGKAPTRILLSICGKKKKFDYFGKPSRNAQVSFINFLNNINYNKDEFYRLYVEFDRGGIITVARSEIRSDYVPVPHRVTNIPLWQFYHPEVGVENYPSWLKFPYRVKDHVYKLA